MKTIKILAMLMAIAMTFALAGCNKDSNDNSAALGSTGITGTPDANSNSVPDNDADADDANNTPAPAAASATDEQQLIAVLTNDGTTEVRLRTAIELAGQLPQTAELTAAIEVANARLLKMDIAKLSAIEFVDRFDFIWIEDVHGDWQPARPIPHLAQNLTGTRSPHFTTVVIEAGQVAIMNGIDLVLTDSDWNKLLYVNDKMETVPLIQGDAATIIGITEPGTYYVRAKDAGIFLYEVYGSNMRGAVDVLMAEAMAKEGNVYGHFEIDENGLPVVVSYDRDGTKVTGAVSIKAWIFNGTQLARWTTERIDLLRLMGDPDAMDRITRDVRVRGVELAILTNLTEGERNDYTITTHSLGIFIGNLAGNDGLHFIYGSGNFDVASSGTYYEFRIEVGKTDAQARELAKEWLLSNGVDLTGLREFTFGNR